MRVCDSCRDLDAPVAEVRLAILQPNPDNGRVKPEELRALTLELCPACVERVWEKVAVAARPPAAVV